jgi:hypothetical protein
VNVYLSLSGDNLALTDTLALSSHGERLLQFLAENDILDEHALNLDTPSGSDILNDFSNRLSNLLTALNNILEDSSTDNMTESGLSTLHKSLLDVVDTKSSLVRRDDVVVDDGGQAKSNVVLGHADLLWDFGGLNLDIDLKKSLAERVDLDQTRVDSLVELSELGDKTNVALMDFLVRVGANDTAGNSAHGSDDTSENVHCFCQLLVQ